MPADATIRRAPNVILSPHRAASLRKERQAIGRMVVDDLELMASGLAPVVMQVAQPEIISRRIGTEPLRRKAETNQSGDSSQADNANPAHAFRSNNPTGR